MTNDNVRFKFFLPDARVLTATEIEKLPPEKTAAASNAENGLWIEIRCPDASCLDENGHISIPAATSDSIEKKGIWLKLFCPDNQCEITESTDLA